MVGARKISSYRSYSNRRDFKIARAMGVAVRRAPSGRRSSSWRGHEAHSASESPATWRSIFKAGIALLFCLLLIRTTVVATFYVPSESMVPTIVPSQHLIVPKISYGVWVPFLNRRLFDWSSPQRGEIVVFTRRDDPATSIDESARAMVKRVVAIGGDTVELDGSSIVINGEALPTPHMQKAAGDISQRRVLRVPRNSVFLVGDNREESFDSRYWAEPFVQVSRVIGPVRGIY